MICIYNVFARMVACPGDSGETGFGRSDSTYHPPVSPPLPLY